MLNANKNSYLQLKCALEPRVINKAVQRAMRRRIKDSHNELPAAQRLESMQPSLFAPWVNITRAQLGFERLGLRLLNRQLHDEDSFIKLQAVHSLLDEVQKSENALFLINLNCVYRVIDLMTDPDPIIREKSLLILITLTNYYQGRQRILSSAKIFVERLIHMFMRDRREIRYAAALLLKSLTRYRCACEIILKNTEIVESLLKMIKNDHMNIVILHINSLKNLAEWDPVTPLKGNAFQIMRGLMMLHEYRVVQAALECMSQLCKHSVGKRLADKYDMTHFLLHFLVSADRQTELLISAVGLMTYTTNTTMSKWRAREFIMDLSKRLVTLCTSHTIPVLQLRAMQVLINLCDCPSIRAHIKTEWKKKITNITIRTHEQWDGTSEYTSYGLETGHNYRTMCIEDVETIRNEYGDSANSINVHSYIGRIHDVKKHLLKAIDMEPHTN